MDECIIPNVSSHQPLSEIGAESPPTVDMFAKIRKIEERYCYWQRIRGDGNCFYRAVGFGLLLKLLTPWDDEQLRAAQLMLFINAVSSVHLDSTDNGATGNDASCDAQKAQTRLITRLWYSLSGCDGWLESEHADEMLECTFTSAAVPGTVAEEDLTHAVCHDGETDYVIVLLLRRLVAMWLRDNSSALSPGGMTYKEFCDAMHGGLENFIKTVVDPMGEHAETIVLQSLPLALRLPMCVVYFDRREGDGHRLAIHYFAAYTDQQELSPDKVPIHILFKGGHYDLLFHRNRADLESIARIRANAERATAESESDMAVANAAAAQEAANAAVDYGLLAQEQDDEALANAANAAVAYALSEQEQNDESLAKAVAAQEEIDALWG